MSEMDKVPDLRQILGAMVFASKRPLTLNDMRRCLKEVAEEEAGKSAAIFAEVKPAEIKDALESLAAELDRNHYGFTLREVAGGYRLQSDASCGLWLRRMLAVDRPNRLSRPCLETLSIIAYRQPVTRSEIEGVRGVGVDHVIKTLMEMQLVRIVGRSDLPGRPLLYGTSQAFLEHFGLKSLKELNQMEPMLRIRAEMDRADKEAAQAAEQTDAPDAPAVEREPEAPAPPAIGDADGATGGEGDADRGEGAGEDAEFEDEDEDEDEFEDEDDNANEEEKEGKAVRKRKFDEDDENENEREEDDVDGGVARFDDRDRDEEDEFEDEDDDDFEDDEDDNEDEDDDEKED